MILMIVAVIGYASYSLFLPFAEDKLKKSTKEKKTLQKSIIENKQYINSITVGGSRDFYVKRFDEDILNLEKYQSIYEVYDDETIWKSVKSYRKGYLIFAKNGIEFPEIPQRDFAVVIVSPFRKKTIPKFSENQITIDFKMESS